jgi:hypothetical protein
MSTSLSIAELLSHEVVPQPHEAVAIAQSVMGEDARSSEPPFGPLSPETVRISADGTVVCVGCDVAPAVSEVAILLETMLASSAKVPGGLRYTIARALLEVDAPPFDSLSDFSASLERFEQGDRRNMVRNVVARDARAGGPVILEFRPAAPPPPAVRSERRRISPAITELRRHLREADRERFEKTVAVLPATAALPPAKSRRIAAIAAGIAAGVALIVGGETMRLRPATPAPTAGAQTAANVRTIAHPAPRTNAPDVPGTIKAAAAPASASSSARRTLVGTGGQHARTARVDAADTEAHTSGVLVRAVDAGNRPVFSPAFASNGAAIFFHTGRNGDASSAIGMAPTSGDLRVITILDDGAKNYHAQPSPDGRLIAFDSDRDGERGVYVADRDGSNVHRISGSGYAAVPTWSPDGTRLTYLRAEPNNPKVWNLWIQPSGADGAAATRVTNYRYGQPWSASWFPDNRHIAYTHEDTLFVLDLQTGKSRAFASPLKGRLLRTPAVSPDGKTIVFQVHRDGGWLMNVDDGSMKRVLADPSAEEFAWSPDGRRVAYHSRRDGQWGIYVYSGN